MITIKVKDPSTKDWKTLSLSGGSSSIPSDINNTLKSMSQKIDKKQDKCIKKKNNVASAWSESSPYLSYKYSCDIPIEGLTSNDYAEVVFDVAEAISGNYAPICTTSDGKVTIYSSVNKQIIIPTIIIYK